MRIRSKGRLWIVSCAAVTGLISFATACSTTEGLERVDPLARLEALGAAWLQTPATVVYNSTEHKAGSATSVHQCLRQVVETSVETAIRMCNPKGELTLSWDPPDRWRMEISNDRGSSTLLSTPNGAYDCHRSVDEARACTTTSAAELMTRGPFGSILLRPAQVLDMLGPGAADALTARPERQIAGMRAECFSAVLRAPNGDADRSDWCYSEDGILLWSLVEIGGDAAQLEAIDVSTHVSETAFDVDHAA
jgi:hypothetical protein